MNSVEELHERIDWDLTSHQVGEVYSSKTEVMRQKAREFAHLIAGNCPEGREQSLALTHIEIALFYGIAGIARIKDQL